MNLDKLRHKKNIKSVPKTTLKNLFFKALLLGLCVFLPIYSNIIGRGVKNGICLCVNTLIPSLFPFMILATFTINSGVFESPSLISSKLTKKLFYLPGYTYPAIILSFIGGYPVGAKMVKTLYEKNKINNEQLNRMMCFCANSGPAFTISMLGSTLLKNKTIGIIIFFSQLIAGLLVGAICGAKAKLSKKAFYSSENNVQNKKTNIQEVLVDSVFSACESIIQMCSIIVLFIVIIHLAKSFAISELPILNLLKKDFIKTNVKMAMISLSEITYGCVYATKNQIPCGLIAFAIGYGGFCTHLQIISILKNTKFRYKKFLVFRLINASLSAIIFYLVIYFFEAPLPAFSAIDKELMNIGSSSPPIGSLALMIMCIYFMADIKLCKK